MRKDLKGKELGFLRVEAPKEILNWLRVLSLLESVKCERNVSRGEIIRGILYREKVRWEKTNKKDDVDV